MPVNLLVKLLVLPNFAQGGIKDATKLDEILNKVESDLLG